MRNLTLANLIDALLYVAVIVTALSLIVPPYGILGSFCDATVAAAALMAEIACLAFSRILRLHLQAQNEYVNLVRSCSR
ncbi:MAG: hypothetical protein SPL30_09510 [Succinivibrio sp.]|nr:hypothetical protein [Succinivibrio sp.]